MDRGGWWATCGRKRVGHDGSDLAQYRQKRNRNA